ncbi:MAG TPA: hypothetical protein VFX25_25705 [Streptosporangiaceae bacterium]|nr:hypothetical protein [Streptosporangiaceae bacterium]
MTVHDEMSDYEVLRAASESLSALPVASAPDLAAITARGRARRARRLSAVTGLSVAGVAAVTAVALGVSGAFSPAPRLGTIRTAAFTLSQNPNGTDTLTLHPGELFDPAQLQADLAQYGIPAKVTSGSYCTSDPEPAGFSHVVSLPGPGNWRVGSSQQPSITIDPSAMPAGTELSFGSFRITTGEFAGELQADMDLISTSSFTCTSTPPTPGPGTPGFGALYGGHTKAGR